MYAEAHLLLLAYFEITLNVLLHLAVLVFTEFARQITRKYRERADAKHPIQTGWVFGVHYDMFH